MLAVRVLHVDDDPDLREVTREYLELAGFSVVSVGDGEAALAAPACDLVVLDVTLPGIDGLEVCSRLRLRTSVPIILVSARPELELRIRGLEGGADDFLVKPYLMPELAARIRAHVRRARGEVLVGPHHIDVGALAIDLDNRSVTLGGIPIPVTTTELAVLGVLAQHAGQAVSRETLLQLLHGVEEAAFDRSIDVMISRLRAKLEPDPRNPQWIKTVRRAGYMLMAR